MFKSKRPTDETGTSFCRNVVLRVVKERKPVFVLDADAKQDLGLADTWEVLRINSVMCVPLISRSQMLGAIYYVDSMERTSGFRKDDLCLLMDLGQRPPMAIEPSRLSATLFELADELSSDD